MNCGTVISSLGFKCKEIGEETLRIWSPFIYPDDGERIGFYVERTPSGYRVTDNCEALMQAEARGLTLSKKRLEAVRRASCDDQVVTASGEIEMFASEHELPRALAGVLNAALAVSHLQPQWAPRQKAESFVREVEDLLESVLPGRVIKKPVVTGASGHQLELPLAITTPGSQGLVYIQPIATTEEAAVDWKRVYEGWGRMTDLRNAQLPSSERLVVMQDAANDPGMQHALSVLTESSAVVVYSRLRQWAEQRRA